MTVPKLIDVKNLEELKLWADKVFEALQGTTSSTSTGSSGVINSIQRGTIAVANGTSSNTATITSVDVTKSELRVLGQGMSGGGGNDGYIVLTNATTITATRATTAGITTISWELTEYV